MSRQALSGTGTGTGTGARRWTTISASAVLFVAVLIAPGVAAAAPTAPPNPPTGGGPRPGIVETRWGDAAMDRLSLAASRKHSSMLDPGSLASVTAAIGARWVWRQKDDAGQAITGRGVTVALLDSGVEAVPGLDAPQKIVRGPDLSLESNSVEPLAFDTYGHGTHLAGIIAAAGVGTAGEPPEVGVAPAARLLALKLATTDGSTDVSQVIAALDWAAQHQQDNGLNVRVVNLAFGTTALQPYQVDPLAAAAEHAWRSGLVVVVSGGNDGPDAGSLTNPAIDPYVIAVGSADAGGTTAGWRSPRVSDFSSRGTAARHVDLVAPGRSIVSLRAPGSFVDRNYPEGLVAGDTTGRLFRGSGTSQAAAVVSGAAALLLQANPALTPDQVKRALMGTARPIAGVPAVAAGAGHLDVAAAVAAVRNPAVVKRLTASAAQTWPAASGLGSLDAARGGSHLADPETGTVLSGEVDILGTAWDPAAWSAASAGGTSWDGGLWMRARWSGDGWTATGWATARWSDTAWDRARWSDTSWDRARWSRARWNDASWERARWNSARWS